MGQTITWSHDIRELNYWRITSTLMCCFILGKYREYLTVYFQACVLYKYNSIMYDNYILDFCRWSYDW